jgi:hypothetical protein
MISYGLVIDKAVYFYVWSKHKWSKIAEYKIVDAFLSVENSIY